MGRQKLDPPGAVCSNPLGVALEATLDHYHLSETDRAGGLPAPPYLKESSAAGWLEGPSISQLYEQLFIVSPAPETSVSRSHRGPSLLQAAGQAHLPVP